MRIIGDLQGSTPYTLRFSGNTTDEAEGAIIMFIGQPLQGAPVEIAFGVDDLRTIIRDACHRGDGAIQSVARETCALAPPNEKG